MGSLTLNSPPVRVRKATEAGREFLVAPMSLINPGILNGSQGALLYTPDDCKQTINDWNGIPIVVYHPTRNGVNVSATSPGVWEESGVGRVKNARFDRKSKAEGWFDVEKLRQVDNTLPENVRILPRLMSGKTVELSTGLFTDNDPTPGLHEGRDYDAVARNHRPDHLAVLPDQVGACSVNDGCGVMVNRLVVNSWAPVANQGDSEEMVERPKVDGKRVGKVSDAPLENEDEEAPVKNSLWRRVARALGLTGNAEDFSDVSAPARGVGFNPPPDRHALTGQYQPSVKTAAAKGATHTDHQQASELDPDDDGDVHPEIGQGDRPAEPLDPSKIGIKTDAPLPPNARDKTGTRKVATNVWTQEARDAAAEARSASRTAMHASSATGAEHAGPSDQAAMASVQAHGASASPKTDRTQGAEGLHHAAADAHRAAADYHAKQDGEGHQAAAWLHGEAASAHREAAYQHSHASGMVTTHRKKDDEEDDDEDGDEEDCANNAKRKKASAVPQTTNAKKCPKCGAGMGDGPKCVKCGAVVANKRTKVRPVQNRRNIVKLPKDPAQREARLTELRPMMLNFLATNCSCPKERSAYSDLNSETLRVIYNAKAEGSNADVIGDGGKKSVQAGGEEDDDGNDTADDYKSKEAPGLDDDIDFGDEEVHGKKMSDNQRNKLSMQLYGMPHREIVQNLQFVAEKKAQARQGLLERLTANAGSDKLKREAWEVYSRMDLGTLRKLANALPPPDAAGYYPDSRTLAANYLGAAGGPSDFQVPEAEADPDDVLQLPTLNYAEIAAEQRADGHRRQG